MASMRHENLRYPVPASEMAALKVLQTASHTLDLMFKKPADGPCAFEN